MTTKVPYLCRFTQMLSIRIVRTHRHLTETEPPNFQCLWLERDCDRSGVGHVFLSLPLLKNMSDSTAAATIIYDTTNLESPHDQRP